MEPRALMAADLYISEILASNDGAYPDEDGDFPDWIEIHNRGDAEGSLAGWRLTDNPANLNLWSFPDMMIPAGGRRVVFASDKNRTNPAGNLHTNFRLEAAGEYLALVNDLGQIVSSFDPAYPRQRDNISYGFAPSESAVTLIDESTPSSYIIPTAEINTEIGQTWTGTSFDDSSWTSAAGGIGFEIAPPPVSVPGEPAYIIGGGSTGNQAFIGSLGMDFVVDRPINVRSLGVFDDGGNGLSRALTVQLWARNDAGTPDNFTDDVGTAILASATFNTGTTGTLVGGSRFQMFSSPLALAPGSYSIVAFGYGATERNGNSGGDGTFGSLSDSDALRFVGHSRYSPTASTAFPTTVDLGPANRYGAGTFTFEDPSEPTSPPIVPEAEEHIAYRTVPGIAIHEFPGNLGMDFDVTRPIRVTELGVFDSGLDGIKGGVGVTLWRRNLNIETLQGQLFDSDDTGTLLAAIDFSAGEGRLEPGTGSRFIALDSPIILEPGRYTINSSGYIGEDRYGEASDPIPLSGSTDVAGGAIRYVFSSRYSIGDPSRFAEEPYHRFPNRRDVGPNNKWAAGTFKFEIATPDLYETTVAGMHATNASAYLRIPFDVSDPGEFAALRLDATYDDGFVAYLNGVEVARRNAPAATNWNSAATPQRPATAMFTPELIDLTGFRHLLVSGANVLAVHALNGSAGDAEFVFAATIEATVHGESELRYFTTPTPGAPNSGGVAGIVADTDFSIDRGFVAMEDRDANGLIHVEITTPTDGATIYYTTNGTEPSPSNGSAYTGPIAIGTTTTLRAAAYRDGYLPTDVDTHTYIFLEDVAFQPSAPAGYPDHWNGTVPDYGMDPSPVDWEEIAGQPGITAGEYSAVIAESLLSLPTLSIVLPPEDLFGPATGLYSNTYPRGEEWERAASVEYILPDGSTGFQVNAGLQMAGWTSRIPQVSPKHTLRVVFKDEYGPGRLNYEFFEGLNVDSFNSIALRANSRDTWVADNGGLDPRIFNIAGRETRATASYIRDEWMRETEKAMGQPTAEGSYVHLYLNGLYWGVYNTTERPDAAYAEEHFGGAEEDYDVFRFCNPSPELVDGNATAWNSLVQASNAGFETMAAYQRILGNNPDGTRNPALPVLLDVESLVDFMVGGYYHASGDWPCNWYAIRDRRPETSEGFKFLQWDGDLAHVFGDVIGRPLPIEFWTSTPGRFDLQLRHNLEYRLKTADHVQKHFFNGGALTSEAAAARWDAIGQEVRPALVAESARWGDYRRDIFPTVGSEDLYTVGDYWDPFNQYMLDTYFPLRSQFVLDLLGYPALPAPELSQHGGDIAPGVDIGITAPTGTVYYTTDGTDPRDVSTGVIEQAVTLVAEAAPKRAFIPTNAALGTSWRGGNEPFNDTAWISGTNGVGYDFVTTGVGAVDYTPVIGTDTGGMVFVNSSMYVRVPFQMTNDPVSFNQMTLRMKFDDGFVAFLNGVEIARYFAPYNLTHNAVAFSGRTDAESLVHLDFDVSSFVKFLRPGQNILAIQGLNTASNSSDILILPELIVERVHPGDPSATAQVYAGEFQLAASGNVRARAFNGVTWSAITDAAFTVSNPLRIAELMYNPATPNDATEFIELVNTGPAAISLVGVALVRENNQGVVYEFFDTDVVTSLDPGQRIVIAGNREAFLAAYPDAAILLADRQFSGNLDNGGEQLTLRDSDGGLIQQFSYNDDWYPTTDGDGLSLVIVDESAPKSAWNDAAAWRASFEEGGTPGEADVLPGDVNGDNAVTWQDVRAIQANYGMSEGATLSHGDVNGDGSVNAADVYQVISRMGQSFAAEPNGPVSVASASSATARRWSAEVLAAVRSAAAGMPPVGVPSYTPPLPRYGYNYFIPERPVSVPVGVTPPALPPADLPFEVLIDSAFASWETPAVFFGGPEGPQQPAAVVARADRHRTAPSSARATRRREAPRATPDSFESLRASRSRDE